MVGLEGGQPVEALGVALDAWHPLVGGTAPVLVVEEAALTGELHVRDGITAGVADPPHVDDHHRPGARVTGAEAADDVLPLGVAGRTTRPVPYRRRIFGWRSKEQNMIVMRPLSRR
jgi:hypothetical protein